MQLNMQLINNDNIEYAESILLKEWYIFDEERRDFIKNLGTIDLQAVPWSWKTTALLAKLLILEKKMPFEDWRGILVLSHTNTAVDEIKEKIWKISPKLFEFPNFIWTIQEFINKFLTKPYGINYLWIKFQHIDSEYFNSKIEYFYKWLWKYSREKWYIDRNNDPLRFLQKLILDQDNNLIKWLNGQTWLRANSTSSSYTKVFELRKKLRDNGIISYDEAYFYWDLYIQKYPRVKKLLQNRFKYIFVDEMQDMQSHQVQILEKVFFDDGNLESKLQRIWDTNQAIYDGIVSVDCIWKWRDEITWNPDDVLKLRWSHRLTKKIWDVVQCFSLVDNEITWKKEILDAGNIDISMKPIFLVYSDNHLNNPDSEPVVKNNRILEAFTEIIEEKKSDWYFIDIEEDKIICKAVIWSAKPEFDRSWNPKFELDKSRAKHYYYDYDIAWETKFKTWFKSDKDYLVYFNQEDTAYKSKYNNLVNLLLRILRNNDIKNTDNKFFNKSSLFRFLNENHEENSIELKTKLFDWSKRLNNTNIDEIAGEIDIYFSSLITIFPWGRGVPPLRIKDSNCTPWVIIENADDKKKNVYINNWIEVSVGTVHSVKWETHTCTLYMESSSRWYESFPKIGKDSYLWEEFNWQASYGREALKMLYVWLSRPTHLLCYAIHKDRYSKLIEWTWNGEKLKEFWDIIEIPIS